MAPSKSSQFTPSFSTPPKVFITGATGFVGSHLAERLAELGCELRLLLRKSSKLDHIAGLKFTRVYADLRDEGGLRDAIADADYIFHSAGLVKAVSAAEFMSVNADATAKLAQLAATECRNLQRFVYISSQAAAGPSTNENCGGHVLRTEADPPAPVSDYGRSKLAGEVALSAFKDRLPITIIRPPAVFGPRDTEVLTFFKFVKSGLLLKFGGRESFVSIVYIDDLVDGIVRAAFQDAGRGETFFVNTLDELSQWQAQYLMAEAMKVDIRPLRIPLWLLRRLAPLAEQFDRRQGQSPTLGADKVKELSCQYWLSSAQKARERLGFAPLRPIAESLQITYQWYVERRWL